MAELADMGTQPHDSAAEGAASDSSMRPRCVPLSAVLRDLAFNFLAPVGGDDNPLRRRLSSNGGGGHGGLISMANVNATDAYLIILLRLGRRGLFLEGLAPASYRPLLNSHRGPEDEDMHILFPVSDAPDEPEHEDEADDEAEAAAAPPAAPPAAPASGGPRTLRSSSLAARPAPTPAPAPSTTGRRASNAELAKKERRDLAIARGRAAATDSPCAMCKGAHEDAWHLIGECTHPGIAAVSRDMRASVMGILQSITGALLVKYRKPVPSNITAAVAACLTECRALRWERVEGRFILHRLLLALPFPASAAAPGHKAVLALGALFDVIALAPAKLRSTATVWMRWSTLWARALATARFAAYKAAAAEERRRVAVGT